MSFVVWLAVYGGVALLAIYIVTRYVPPGDDRDVLCMLASLFWPLLVLMAPLAWAAYGVHLSAERHRSEDLKRKREPPT